MFKRLSLRPGEDLPTIIRTEMMMGKRGSMGRVVFAVVIAGCAFMWLPPAIPVLYAAVAAIWELALKPRFIARMIAKHGNNYVRLRRTRLIAVFVAACFYAALPVTGLFAHALIAWYAALIGFCWATIVGITYFSNSRWLYAACTAPAFIVASAAPIVFGSPLPIVAAVLALHVLFVVSALQSAVHRAELVESISKQHAARTRAESANVEKSQFIANISHELRSPLNAIIGYSELLRESAEEEKRGNDLADVDRVLGASRTLLGLVNELLDISKIEAGKLALDLSWYSADEMIAAAASRARAAMPNSTLRVNIEVALGEGMSDEARLGQCVLNLISATAKMADGAVTLRAARVEDDFVIEVAHAGIIASAEKLERLFDPFADNQAEATASGLGVAVTRRIARLLGGDVVVTTRPGAGAAFTMRTPVAVSTAANLKSVA